MDYDDSKIDDDLDKILQHIKEEQQNSMVLFFFFFLRKSSIYNFVLCFKDAPDSPKVEPFAGSSIGGLESSDPSTNTNDNMYKFRPSRHLLYATHFPLPLVNSQTNAISNLLNCYICFD